MLVNRKFDLAVVAIVAAVVVYVALQPTYRLRPDPPPEFIRAAHAVPMQKRTEEEKIARAYWQSVVVGIQWKYGYGHRLPPVAPPEFVISSQEFGAKAADEGTRIRYWTKLQAVWYMESVWQKEYGWHFRSFRDAFNSAGNWLQEQSSRFKDRQ